MEIKKIENCDYVMFPRLQEQGVESEHVEREAFRYPENIKCIVYALSDSARWWHEYR